MTKSQQTFGVGSHLTLTDTSGPPWPQFEHDSNGYMLAASHAIRTDAVVEIEVATRLAELLLARYPGRLAEQAGDRGEHRRRGRQSILGAWHRCGPRLANGLAAESSDWRGAWSRR